MIWTRFSYELVLYPCRLSVIEVIAVGVTMVNMFLFSRSS